MRKDFGAGLVVAGILAVIFVAVYFVIIPNLPQATTTLRLGDGVFTAGFATDETSRTRGLSGTTELKSNQALIMAYPSSDRWGIWMKDMSYPIDIVWLDANKKVIDVYKNATPDNPTITHKPKTSAVYVVEFTAGTIVSKAIGIDDVADFQINAAEIK